MIISRLALSTVMPACTNDDTRYSLNSIQVARDGDRVRMSATNGNILIRTRTAAASLPDAEFPEKGPTLTETDRAMIPLGAARELVKTCVQKGRARFRILDGAKLGRIEGRPVAVVTDLDTVLTFDMPADDTATFPDGDRVFPKTEGPIKVSLGLEVLETLCAAMRAGDTKFVVLTLPEPVKGAIENAIAFRWTATKKNVGHDVDVDGVLMPARL